VVEVGDKVGERATDAHQTRVETAEEGLPRVFNRFQGLRIVQQTLVSDGRQPYRAASPSAIPSKLPLTVAARTSLLTAKNRAIATPRLSTFKVFGKSAA
jgi:hypothetical protein